ncbi:glyoxalase domain-containing protein 4-like isoform X1 [Lytechinus variegatus]|uniref:glyoxalase domain-containing protein 4-like isoform X1 n=2 Tax=Lytechinus variegatus TaxID=7654 RepID=UPI001BB0DB76|nr:glyoxalase domain-containing protein 4-like isoform X1 [Lytechinus variegatus]
MSGRRALHFVFKVADRTATAKFYREILGMKFLRHEEFEEGCKATCNGPYDGKWSKSMVGYGPEDNHFVTELTYNYGVKSYDLGNDFLGITIQCSVAVANAKKAKWPLTIESEGVYSVQAPGGYRFYLVDKPRPEGDPVQKVAIGVSNLQKSVDYWTNICGMTLYEKAENSALLGFGEGQCRLELLDQGGPIDHKTAFGRVAFACPRDQLPGIEAASKDGGQTIITPLISLDTPGKATVEVVILGDPDGHEICFVGDEAFRELSQVDPKADGLLDEAVAADKSVEWFAKKEAKLGKQWTPGS